MSASETARAAWGDELPEWVSDLARECEATSQNKVAGQMGYSSSLISQLLHRKYPGDLAAIREIFVSVFQQELITCPALGDIPALDCREWREKAKAFVNTSNFRARMFRACNRCPRNGKEKS
jgi:hypothetical protein